MTERPSPPPEGELITAALKRMKLSQREAARRAGMSEGRWRQIAAGYQTVSGTHIPVRAPAKTIAKMAAVVNLAPTRLVEAGREDAAAELQKILRQEAHDALKPGELLTETLITGEQMLQIARQLPLAVLRQILREEEGEAPQAADLPPPVSWEEEIRAVRGLTEQEREHVITLVKALRAVTGRSDPGEESGSVSGM